MLGIDSFLPFELSDGLLIHEYHQLYCIDYVMDKTNDGHKVKRTLM